MLVKQLQSLQSLQSIMRILTVITILPIVSILTNITILTIVGILTIVTPAEGHPAGPRPRRGTRPPLPFSNCAFLTVKSLVKSPLTVRLTVVIGRMKTVHINS